MKSLFSHLLLMLIFMQVEAQNLSSELLNYCKTLESEFSQISEERKENLRQVSQYILEKWKQKETVNLTFICTHNSRRSQFGQVWAKVAAIYYGFEPKQFLTFSGGTETTACNPRTISALQRAGVEIEKINEISASLLTANNPRYAVKIAKGVEPFFLFSKKYNDDQNPTQNYCAILVCSQADEACPMVIGAEKRIYHGYEDPKRSDGTNEEAKIYDETCRLIAREIFYVFEQVRNN